MSLQLINRSADLRKLADDGYAIDIVSGYLILRNVPYVTAQRKVARGALISALDLAGDVTRTPTTHVVLFAGEYPCDASGRPLEAIRHQTKTTNIADGLVANHSFSSKPKDGYQNYYDKMSTYAAIISAPALAIDPEALPYERETLKTESEESVFQFTDTASSRAGIADLSRKIENERVGIIGLGGTGSYLLDFVAKTAVREVHLFDDDEFLQHNAFRAPGAPAAGEFTEGLKKVHYFKSQYERVRKNIFAHELRIDDSNLDKLKDLTFIFVCIDHGSVKRPIVDKLDAWEIPFIDVGMGLELVDDQLLGVLRVTTSTPDMRAHVVSRRRINFTSGDPEGIYTRNIQIAELNAFNAVLAVVKWKKLRGIYKDFEEEHFSTYTLDGNTICNEDRPCETASP